jgi:hypothetical protein
MNLLGGGPTDGISGASISVDDVAELHVLALNPNISAGRYLASARGKGGRVWTDALDIVKRNFPEAFGTIFATEGNPTVTPLNINTSKTEKTFGFTFQRFGCGPVSCFAAKEDKAAVLDSTKESIVSQEE